MSHHQFIDVDIITPKLENGYNITISIKKRGENCYFKKI